MGVASVFFAIGGVLSCNVPLFFAIKWACAMSSMYLLGTISLTNPKVGGMFSLVTAMENGTAPVFKRGGLSDISDHVRVISFLIWCFQTSSEHALYAQGDFGGRLT